MNDKEIKEVKEDLTENKEVVEAEVVDEKIEEVTDPGITREVGIDETTYLEFFDRNGLKSQFKSSALIIVVLWAVLFALKGEMEFVDFLVQGLIYTAVYIGVSILMTLLTNKVFTKRNYYRSGLNKLLITANFNKTGITQTVGQQSSSTQWSEISHVDETTYSIFCYSGKKAVIFSKRYLQAGDIEYIRSIAKAALGEENYNIIESKIKPIDQEMVKHVEDVIDQKEDKEDEIKETKDDIK